MRARTLTMADCREFRQLVLSKPPALVRGSIVLLVLLVVAMTTWAALSESDRVVHARGRVRPIGGTATVVNGAGADGVVAGVGGRVVTVQFEQGDSVRAGQELVALDTTHLDSRIEQLRGRCEAIEQQLERLARLRELTTARQQAARERLEARISAADEDERARRESRLSELESARLELDAARAEEVRLDSLCTAAARLAQVCAANARAEYQRLEHLVGRGIAPETELTDARVALRVAEHDLESRRSPLELLAVRARIRSLVERVRRAELEVEPRAGEIEVLRAELAVDEADYRRALEGYALDASERTAELERLQLQHSDLERAREHATIRTPRAGVITSRPPKPGDVLETGDVVAVLAVEDGLQLHALVGNRDVGELAVGMAAEIRFDAYDHRRYGVLRGRVVFISPDSEEVGPQAMYTIKVEFRPEDAIEASYPGAIRLGMTGEVEVVVARETVLSRFLRRVHRVARLD